MNLQWIVRFTSRPRWSSLLIALAWVTFTGFVDLRVVPNFLELFEDSGIDAWPIPTEAIFSLPRGALLAFGLAVGFALSAKDRRLDASQATAVNIAVVLALLMIAGFIVTALFLPMTVPIQRLP